MIDITKLLYKEYEEDSLRYSKGCRGEKSGARQGTGPVVAWNITQKCNYRCSHCYASSEEQDYKNELSFGEVKNIVDNLSDAKVPVILLSGGEPLFREDIFEIIGYIRERGIRVSLSTNGSLIDEKSAGKLKELGIGYAGISIDGREETNDSFRGVKGAFNNSMRAIENCKKAGIQPGLRFTLNSGNYREVPFVLKLMDEMDVKRICFYHLVPSGRGSGIADSMMKPHEAREVLDILYEESKKSLAAGNRKEILTVTNHADGPYIYMKAKQEDPELAEKMLEKLKRNGGNRSGIAIANIDSFGNVYPDQFSRFMKLGSLRESSFQDIWSGKNKDLEKLRDRKLYLNRRCKECSWLDICNGNLRARAYNTSGDFWAEDPGCYLD